VAVRPDQDIRYDTAFDQVVDRHLVAGALRQLSPAGNKGQGNGYLRRAR
jgi:hypothetical protein